MDERQLTFEQISEQLEQIIAALEGGELPLEQMLEHYARGVELVAQGRKRLDAAEAKLTEEGAANDGK